MGGSEFRVLIVAVLWEASLSTLTEDGDYQNVRGPKGCL